MVGLVLIASMVVLLLVAGAIAVAGHVEYWLARRRWEKRRRDG